MCQFKIRVGGFQPGSLHQCFLTGAGSSQGPKIISSVAPEIRDAGDSIQSLPCGLGPRGMSELWASRRILEQWVWHGHGLFHDKRRHKCILITCIRPGLL